jgi:protein-arginine kinase activator protein McsA
MQQFRPQVLMLNTRAKATQKLLVEDYAGAIETIEAGLEEVQHKRPLSTREKLELDLNEAVQREDYERAARVRDALRNLKRWD